MTDMATTFSRRRGAVVLKVDAAEVPLLRDLFAQLTVLLEPTDEPTGSDDPLNAMVGIGTSTQAPADPALARLLPDAYPEDEEAASEFRRYTELGLRDSKRARAGLVLATLDTPGKVRALSEDEAQAWLTSINDLRLVLGTRLDVSEDPDEDWAELSALPQDDPRLLHHAIYDWLGGLQWSLLQVLG
jgi:Domain of unknown function (DUF2017)